MTLPDRLTFDRLRDGERLELSADEAERAELAARYGLLSLDRLEAHAAIARDGDVVHARGRLRAQLSQACIATGEACLQAIDEPFDLTFRPDPGVAPDEEIELAADELDTLFHDGQAIDLKAALEDTLALSIDPYPRSAGADAALKEAGVLSEEEAGPFAGLAALRDKLGGKDA
jgi:uncharacterized metal-binding protein YceD (DUF177 family)